MQNIESAKCQIAEYRMAKYRPRKMSTDNIWNTKYLVLKYRTQYIEEAKYRTQIIEGAKYRKAKDRKTKHPSGITSKDKISNRQNIEIKISK